MIKEISFKNLDKSILKNGQPALVQVYTRSCPNCKRLHPVFEETARLNYKSYSFYKVDARKNIEFVKKYKVLGVPALLFFRHGKLVDKKTGVISRKRIEKRLEPLMNYSIDDVNRKEVKGYFKLPWK